VRDPCLVNRAIPPRFKFRPIANAIRLDPRAARMPTSSATITREHQHIRASRAHREMRAVFVGHGGDRGTRRPSGAKIRNSGRCFSGRSSTARIFRCTR
jgi:hypothetical protein